LLTKTPAKILEITPKGKHNYDLDMTLIDVRERYNRALEDIGYPKVNIDSLPGKIRRLFWSIFLSDKYLHLDKPIENTIKDLREKYSLNYGIIILTGRPKYMEKSTIRQLHEFDIPYHLLVMRDGKNFKSSIKFKIKVISDFLNQGLEIIEIHDDDKRIQEDMGDVPTTACKYYH